ncbi:hypothetical protein BDP27DRAFT_1504073, partial [Rhodocollybia butyracea]
MTFYYFALSPQGLQQKMDLFYEYCGHTLLLINAIKSAVAYHGSFRAAQLPTFHFNGEQVDIVKRYTYVGMVYRTGDFRAFSSIIEPHYTNKAAKARKIAHAVLHIESMIGCLPVHEGKILYMGCIDPHLIQGCEVAIDTSPTLIEQLNTIQLSFFRRLLGLSKTSIKVPIYITETGIIPLHLRRLQLQIRSLAYFIDCPNNALVRAALNESIALNSSGHSSWFGDLKQVIEKLAPSAKLPDNNVIISSTELVRVSKRSYILLLHKEPLENGRLVYHDICMHTYLNDIQNSQHRKALTKFITGDHPLAVVRLTWTDNHRLQVPYDERLCRFCKSGVETPEHALLSCPHVPLAVRRNSYLEQLYILNPNVMAYTNDMIGASYIAYLASCRPFFSILAEWVYEVTNVYEGSPLYVPYNTKDIDHLSLWQYT